MSNRIGTFSMSGRSTNHNLQRPALISNHDTQGPVPNNASRCAMVQENIQAPRMKSTQKAKAVARSQSTPTSSEAVPTSLTSPNQTEVSAAPVLKEKNGRGCNKAEEAPANPADRRHISLTPLGGWFDKKVPRTIGSHLRTGLKGGYPNWTMVPKDDKRTLWYKFECTYVWDPAEDGAIRALWEHTMAETLGEAVYRARTKKKPKWCADTHFKELQAYWNSPEFKRRSEAAKANRNKAPRVTHTTGSKSMERAAIEKAQERGVPEIPYIENYSETHMKRNPADPNAAPEWIDKKFHDVYDRYVEECTEDFGEDRATWPNEVDPEKWIKAIGSPKNGRIMGLSVHMNPEELGFNTRKRSLFPRVSTSSQESRREVIELRGELDEVKQVAKDASDKCTQLQAELEAQKTQHAELMELVRSRLQVNQSNQDVIGSSSVVGGGRQSANEQFDIDDFLGQP